MDKKRPNRDTKTWGIDGKSLARSTMIWIPDLDPESDNVWLKAEVQSSDDRGLRVKIWDSNAIKTIPSSTEVFLCNEEIWSDGTGLSGVQDLSVLMHLHEPEVLQTLQYRFDIDKIYTSCDQILIAVNPFKIIPNLYSEQICKVIQEKKPPPHIFTIAHRALSSLAKDQQPQVILVSGESGAGKTETTKHALKFLSETMGSRTANDDRRSTQVRKEMKEALSTEQKVLQSNPLLEAFGNACTVRNNNSSRFGKFIELQFDGNARKSRFIGALINVYLLEKIRVTEIVQNERSYHIFYQACAARSRFGPEFQGIPLDYFGSPNSFVYLAKSSVVKLKSMDDAEEFERMQASMTSLGVSKDEQISIIKIIALVLHIGNITFSGRDDAEVKAGNKSFEIVSSLLHVRKEDLAKALTHKLISVSPSERYESPLNPKQAEERREAMTRFIYGILFEHIVAKVNLSLQGLPDGDASTFIGVLDIFGFEHFENNSFEQLCINFANERLQKLFNDFVFKMEMELYASEGIDYDGADFPDNQDIIDLIQAKGGSIFALLDEECRLNGNDKNFCSKVTKNFADHERFKVVPNRRNSTFQIQHFAGHVTYSVHHFLDKNVDEVGDLMRSALESSQDDFFMQLLSYRPLVDTTKSSSKAKAPTGKKNPQTVSFEFKTQLEALILKLKEAKPHFVRCIKPNPQSRPEQFARRAVAEQLRSGGVIEALRVQRSGFPCRAPREVCWKEIQIVLKEDVRSKCKSMEIGKRLHTALTELEKELGLRPGSWAVGKTTVFYKQKMFEAIENARLRKLNAAATRIQTRYRSYHKHLTYIVLRDKCIFLQAWLRRFLVRLRIWKQMSSDERVSSLLFATLGSKNALLVKKQQQAERRRQEEVEAERRRKDAEEEEKRRRSQDTKRQAEEQIQRMARAEQAAKEGKAQADRLQAEIQSMRDKTQSRETELQGLLRKLEAEKAETVQNAKMKEQTLTERIRELEGELAHTQQKLIAQEESFKAKLLHEQEKAARVEADLLEQQEELRKSFDEQIRLMHSTLEANQKGQFDELQKQAAESKKQHEEISKKAHARKEKLKKQHNEALKKMEAEQAELQRRMEDDLKNAQGNNASMSSQIEMLQQQAEDAKKQHEEYCALLQAQAEDYKKEYHSQVEILEKRNVDRETSHTEELELLRKQRDEQIIAFKTELANQKHSLLSSSKQEIDFVKKQAEQREESLMHTLERAKKGQTEFEEKKKTLEVQLAVKVQQQEELQRVAEAQTRHLQDSAVRQQERHERHVQLLERQLQENRENFERQLAESQAQASEHLRQVTKRMDDVEKHFQEEREQEWKLLATVRTASQQSASLLAERVKALKEEAEGLRKERISTKERLMAMSSRDQKVDLLNNDDLAKKSARADSRLQEIAAEISGLEAQFQGLRRHDVTESSRSSPRVQLVDTASRTSLDSQDGQRRPNQRPRLVRASTWADSASLQTKRVTLMKLYGGSSSASKKANVRSSCVEFQTKSKLSVDGAVTNLCLSNPSSKEDTITLAVACQTGLVSVFSISRESSTSNNGRTSEPNLTLQFQAHKKAITAMCFASNQHDLVTASTDWTMVVWSLRDGRRLLEVSDSSVVLCVMPLPRASDSFILANAGSILRLVIGDAVQQKLRLDKSIRSLALGLDGDRLLAGSAQGWLYGFDVGTDELSLSSKLRICEAAITSIVIVPGSGRLDAPAGSCPMLVANVLDSTTCVLKANANFTNFTVLHRFNTRQKLLPLRCCHFPCDSVHDLGFVASGSEDSKVRIFDLMSLQEQRLSGHGFPVVGVSACPAAMLLASGDTRGSIVLWQAVTSNSDVVAKR